MKKIRDTELLKMSSMNIKDSDKANLVILLVLIVCFLLGYFIMMPAVASYKKNKLVIANKNQQKERIAQKETMLKGLGNDLEQESDFIKLGEQVLPTDPQIPEILFAIDKLATTNSLYMSAFTPNVTAESKTTTEETKKVLWKTIDLQFDVVGTYPNIKAFIKDLENNIRTIDIVNISINGGGDIKNSDSALRFHIGAKAYYQ